MIRNFRNRQTPSLVSKTDFTFTMVEQRRVNIAVFVVVW